MTTLKEGDPGDWYTALIALRCFIAGGKPCDPIFELRAITIRATSESEVRSAAEALSAEEEYRNAAGESVTWRFAEIVDICAMPTGEGLTHGAEVYFALVTAAGLADVKRGLSRRPRA